jgi:hypothetical protein
MDMCYEAFNGWSAYPQVNWMNTVYGGTSIAANNIVFSSGSIDPWHALGVTEDIKKMATTSEIPLYIVGTSHCQDLKAPKSTDPKTLTDARKVISKQVNSWLSESDNSSSNDDDDDEDDALSTSAKIGIASVVIIVVLSAVIVGVFFGWKRALAKSNADNQNSNAVTGTVKTPLI